MNLKNCFLIATPDLQDSLFHQAVVLISEHSDEGAMGFIINSETQQDIEQVFEQLNLTSLASHNHSPIFFGGPVSENTGFVLHKATDIFKSTIKVNSEIQLTTSSDIIEAISQAKLKDDWKFILGYSGWSAGQLEKEINEGSWIISVANSELVFKNDDTGLIWKQALAEIGIKNPLNLMESGHA